MNYKNNQIPKKNQFSPMFYPLPYMPNHPYNFTSQPNQFSLSISMNIMNQNTNKPFKWWKKIGQNNNINNIHDNNKSEKIKYMKTTI